MRGTATVGVVGVGAIGSVLARGFDELGHDVRINDIDSDATDSLPYESATKAQLSRECDLVIFALPTPTTEIGGDYSVVDNALESFSETDATIVLRSTMPPGSTAELAKKHGLPLVYSPEFLRDRSGVDDFFYPDRIVLAGPDEQRALLRSLLDVPEIHCDTIIERRDYITAELGKYAHNAIFATKVSFANQMRLISEAAGADPEVVMDIVTADHRNTSSHLDPMLGAYGGKCLPKDLGALRAFAAGEMLPTPLLDGTKEMNDIAREDYEYLDIEGNWPQISVRSD